MFIENSLYILGNYPELNKIWIITQKQVMQRNYPFTIEYDARLKDENGLEFKLKCEYLINKDKFYLLVTYIDGEKSKSLESL